MSTCNAPGTERDEATEQQPERVGRRASAVPAVVRSRRGGARLDGVGASEVMVSDIKWSRCAVRLLVRADAEHSYS